MAPYSNEYTSEMGPSFVEGLKLPSQLVSWNLQPSPTPSSITFGTNAFYNSTQYFHNLTDNSLFWTIGYFGLSYGSQTIKPESAQTALIDSTSSLIYLPQREYLEICGETCTY